MERDHYVIRGGVEGRERLRILARVMRPTTCSLFDRVRIDTGMACLDVGCGGGDVTFDLARRVGPGGSVVGWDIDETKLGLARREAEEQGLDNVEFRLSDIGDGEAEREFDVVYARFLLTHLKDPAEALTGMRQILRPGGVAIVEDIDCHGILLPSACCRSLALRGALHGSGAAQGRRCQHRPAPAGASPGRWL